MGVKGIYWIPVVKAHTFAIRLFRVIPPGNRADTLPETGFGGRHSPDLFFTLAGLAMLKLSIEFQEIHNLLGFLVAVALCTAWVGFMRRKERTRWVLPPLVLANVAAMLVWASAVGIDEDETELLHTSWMYAQGMQPYVDFWQHHLPIFWPILAPLTKAMDGNPAIYLVTRAIATALTVLIGVLAWRVARKVWGEGADPLSFALVFLGGIGIWQFVWLRTDLPMMALMLAGLLSVLGIASGRRPACFSAGLFIALALSFTVKHYVAVLLPVAVIFADGHKDYVRRIVLTAAGGVLGALPLAVFVLRNDVAVEFVRWVVSFNSTQSLIWTAFQVSMVVVAAAGIVAMVRERDDERRPLRAAFLIAFGLATWATLFTIRQPFNYYGNYWMVLTAVLGAGLGLKTLLPDPRASWRRVACVGAVLTMLTLPNVHFALRHSGTWLWDDLDDMQTFLDVAAGRPVLMLTPEHPVFLPDATRLHTLWQLRFITGPADRNLLQFEGEPGFVERIIANRPAIIARDVEKGRLLLTLKTDGVLSDAEFTELDTFLKANYQVRTIGGKYYHVVNDRVDAVPSGAGR